MNHIKFAALTIALAFSLDALAVETVTRTDKLEEYFAHKAVALSVQTADRAEKLEEYFEAHKNVDPIETVTRGDQLENLDPISFVSQSEVEVITHDVALANYFEERDRQLVMESVERLATPENYEASREESVDSRIGALVKYFKDKEKKQDLIRAQIPKE